VVSPSLNTAGVPFAVEELRKYIRLISGCDLPLAAEASTTPPIVIALRADLSAPDQSALPAPAKGYDGYAIAIRAATADHPPRIFIAGDNPRGVIYGVYDLLERLGCRWFYPTQNPNDPEVVPHQATLSLPAGSWAVASPMQNRICDASSWLFDVDVPNATKQLDWAMKNRHNAMSWGPGEKTPILAQFETLRKGGLIDELNRRGMFLHGPGHCFHHFLRAEDHMAQHPEWFGMRDGQRVPQNFLGAQFCWSNAAARRQFVDNVEKFALACPEIHILCLVPFDGGPACTCPECKKAGTSNTLMVLMREIIERLAKSAPSVLVEAAGGYPPMVEPPTTVQADPRQRVVWAHWGRYHGFGYDDARYDKKNLETWRQVAGGGLTLFQYYSDNFAEPWVLPPFAIAIQGDRKYCLEKGIDSVCLLLWSPGFWWNHGLNAYLAGQCFYDPARDPFVLIQDYALHYYGPAAGPLLGQYYEQWARDVDLAYAIRGDSLPKQWKMLADQRKNFIAPAVAATQGDPVLTARVARVEKLHQLAERLCENHRHRYQIQFLREKGDFDQAKRKLGDARIYAESVLYWFYALADLDQGLIERKDIGFLPKIGVLGWIDAEAQAIADKRGQVEGPTPWKTIPESDLFPTTAPTP
jgi:hypothetical protein